MEIFLDTLKWSLIIGVLTLGLSLLRPAFEKRYSVQWRYWTWLLLAIPALLAPVQWEKLLPVLPAVNTPLVIDVPEMEIQVVQGDRLSVSLQDAYTGLPEGVSPEDQRTWQLSEEVPKVWLCGCGVSALYILAGGGLYRCKAHRRGQPPAERTANIYEAVRRDMGLKKTPPLYVSRAVSSPMLVGLLRPCLLLPGEKWNEEELRLILRHELTHYRRHDLWYKAVLLAARTLHWFNPLLHLLVKEASVDLELTCDDAVVSGMGQEARRAYSKTLLSAVRREKGPALSTHFYGGKEVMKERFRNILGQRSQKRGTLVLALTLAAALACGCAFGFRQTRKMDGALNEERVGVASMIWSEC